MTWCCTSSDSRATRSAPFACTTASRLQQLVDRASCLGGRSVKFLAVRAARLNLNWYSRNQLYGIAQEALNNALAHSMAKNIDVSLLIESRSVRITVADDGRGFSAPTAQNEGFGIATMRFRAAAVNARLSIDSNPDGGTIIEVLTDENDPAGLEPFARSSIRAVKRRASGGSTHV